MNTPHSPFPPEIQALDQQIGEFMEYWGFKRIHGRVWLHLYLTEEPLDVAELMHRLNVSKSLMSFCIRDLKEYSVILEKGVAKHGTVLYEANPDLFSVIRNVLRTRERPLLGRIKAAQQIAVTLPEDELKKGRVSPRKLKSLGKLISSAEFALLALVKLPLNHSPSQSALLDMLARISTSKLV